MQPRHAHGRRVGVEYAVYQPLNYGFGRGSNQMGDVNARS